MNIELIKSELRNLDELIKCRKKVNLSKVRKVSELEYNLHTVRLLQRRNLYLELLDNYISEELAEDFSYEYKEITRYKRSMNSLMSLSDLHDLSDDSRYKNKLRYIHDTILLLLGEHKVDVDNEFKCGIFKYKEDRHKIDILPTHILIDELRRIVNYKFQVK